MKHQATRRFWENYDALPLEIQRLADRCHELLKNDSRHPSLHFRQIGRFWSVRVGLHYRALGVSDALNVVWF